MRSAHLKSLTRGRENKGDDGIVLTVYGIETRRSEGQCQGGNNELQ